MAMLLIRCRKRELFIVKAKRKSDFEQKLRVIKVKKLTQIPART